MKNEQFDLCVIGAGSAGLSVAAGAVQLGLKTALIEKAEMGVSVIWEAAKFADPHMGPYAGELIGLWSLAITKSMKIGDITGMIAPYPTLGEISKRAAGAWFTPKLFSDRTRFIVKWLQKLPF